MSGCIFKLPKNLTLTQLGPQYWQPRTNFIMLFTFLATIFYYHLFFFMTDMARFGHVTLQRAYGKHVYGKHDSSHVAPDVNNFHSETCLIIRDQSKHVSA